MFTNKKSSEAGGGPSAANQQTFGGCTATPGSRAAGHQIQNRVTFGSVVRSFHQGKPQDRQRHQDRGTDRRRCSGRLLTVGEDATIRGQLVGDEVVVNGRIIGKIRGVKVRLNSGARVEGDIIHETIAVEAGAHFEGSVKRQENPLAEEVPGAAARQRFRRNRTSAGSAGTDEETVARRLT